MFSCLLLSHVVKAPDAHLSLSNSIPSEFKPITFKWGGITDSFEVWVSQKGGLYTIVDQIIISGLTYHEVKLAEGTLQYFG